MSAPRALFLAGLPALLLTQAAAADVAPDAPVPICAADAMDRLPSGTPLLVSDALLERARIPPPPTRRGAPPPSDFERRDFPVVFTRSDDGSVVKLSCFLRQTTLHEVETRRYLVLGPARVRDHDQSPAPDDGPPPLPWRQFVYELSNAGGVNRSLLDCATEISRADARSTNATPDKLTLALGVLRKLLAPELTMDVRAETDPERCAAIHAAAP